ncbi:MAG: D-sedoheptulose 7-phosphate isomerase [bacterium]|nr:D-sedoheptulose 7-phosphate isomerase [bacterium]
MRNIITNHLAEHIDVFREISDSHIDVLIQVANSICDCYKNDKKVVLFGNGGSAADAQHIAAELVGRYTMERRSLPAIALNINTSVLTAIANDYHHHQIFERQVEGLVNPGDVVIGISTSGNSENIIRGILKAKEKEALTIAFTGRDGGKIKDVVHISFEVPSDKTPRIQEVHITAGHIICELVEQSLFGNNDK